MTECDRHTSRHGDSRWGRVPVCAVLLGAVALVAGVQLVGHSPNAQDHGSLIVADPSASLSRPAVASDDDIRELAANVSGAGLHALALLAQEHPQSPSVWLSPASLSTALLMLAVSSNLDAAAEVLRAVGLHATYAPTAVRAAAGLHRALTSAPNTAPTWAAIANSLWMRDDVPARPEYIAAMADAFDASVGSVPSDTLSGEPVNSWVSAATHGHIPAIVPNALEPDFVLALVNAVYFRGTWAVQFPKAATRNNRPFYDSDGKTETGRAPLMSVKARFQHAYLGDASMQVIRVPYERCKEPCNADYSAVIVLPIAGMTPEQALAEINRAGGLSTVVLRNQEFGWEEGTLQLPRFEADFKAPLTPLLKRLGVQRVLRAGSGLAATVLGEAHADVPLVVSDVLHAVSVKVDEKGAEAAAVTAVYVGCDNCLTMDPLPFRMTVDRPFLFFAGIVRRVGS
jgi:serine protease inhibitor